LRIAATGISQILSTRVRTQAAYPFGNNGCRVGVIHNPGAFIRVALDQVNKFHHWQNGAQTVRQTARSTGFLTHHPMTQRDFSSCSRILYWPTHLGEDKMGTAKGRFRVAGDGKFDALAVVTNHFFHHRRNGALSGFVNVVEANFRQREILQTHHQAFDNPWRVGAAATGDRENKWGFNIFSLL
jgi:hypothetical protein